MKAPHEDTDGGHTGDVFTRKSTMAVESWMQATRGVIVAESEFYVKVISALILFGATSMMMIDFGNVGQCVFGTQSSSTKSHEKTCVVD